MKIELRTKNSSKSVDNSSFQRFRQNEYVVTVIVFFENSKFKTISDQHFYIMSHVVEFL